MTDVVVTTAAPNVRAPRGLLLVNGQSFDFESVEHDNNTHYQADTFRASIPTSGQADGFDAAWWSAQPTFSVQIWLGYPANPASYSTADLTQVFVGRVDSLTFDPVRRHIEISGRDRTGELIDTKTTEKYANLTSSAIAAKIAGNHGLSTSITTTTTKVGVYYANDYVRLQDDKTEWDLLTYLAREEGFDCYVSGDTLYFNPRDDGAAPYAFTFKAPAANAFPTFGGDKIEFERNMALAKDITVQVRSWNAQRKQGFTKTAKASHSKGPALTTGLSAFSTQTYTYSFPNLTPDQAQARATQILQYLSQHELKVLIEGPARLDLTAQTPISIAGTGTDFDTTYSIDSITRTLDMQGFRWAVRAKNHPTESETVA